MTKVIISFFLLLLFIQGRTQSMLPTMAKQKGSSMPVLLHVFTRHAFSEAVRKDSFSLLLSGKSAVNGQLLFTIHDADHKLLFSDTLMGSDLLWDEADVIPTKAQADTIKARMRRFFAAGQFYQPAISTVPVFDADISDRPIWTELKADRKAIGFVYTYGYEGTYGIVYSKKQRKVVCYFSID